MRRPAPAILAVSRVNRPPPRTKPTASAPATIPYGLRCSRVHAASPCVRVISSSPSQKNSETEGKRQRGPGLAPHPLAPVEAAGDLALERGHRQGEPVARLLE